MTFSLSRLPILRAGAALALLAMAAAPALAQDDAVIATVDGRTITESDLALALSDLDQQFAQMPADQRRAAALTALIEITLLANEAESRGMAEEDAFRQRMEFLRLRALHSGYIEREIAAQVTDQAIRARYDAEVANMDTGEEVRARHIIVESEEEAREIIAELDAGGDFEEIARARSTDGAAARGGDLGYFGAGQMVPEFETAAFAMEVGAHSSEPVRTQFGWHVIRLEDRRAQEPPAFDQVRAQIRSVMLREGYGLTIAALRDAAAIEIADPQLRGVLDEPEDVEAQ